MSVEPSTPAIPNEPRVEPRATGLIAILRGLPTKQASDVGWCLHRAGMRVLEVPLNSPDPFGAIRLLRRTLPAEAVVGAGTVLNVEQVQAAHDAGAEIIVSPNTDVDVITETVRLGMRSYPGVATASEAFRAIGAGARAVKLFPSDQVGIAGMKAWMAVIPAGIEFIPVGGVGPDNILQWVMAGATGFGIGSALYAPGVAIADLEQRATELMNAWTSARTQLRSQA